MSKIHEIKAIADKIALEAIAAEGLPVVGLVVGIFAVGRPVTIRAAEGRLVGDIFRRVGARLGETTVGRLVGARDVGFSVVGRLVGALVVGLNVTDRVGVLEGDRLGFDDVGLPVGVIVVGEVGARVVAFEGLNEGEAVVGS